MAEAKEKFVSLCLVSSKPGSWQLVSVTAPQPSELQQALSVVLLPVLNIKLYLGYSPGRLQQGPGTECLLSKCKSSFLQSQVFTWSTDEPKQPFLCEIQWISKINKQANKQKNMAGNGHREGQNIWTRAKERAWKSIKFMD